eukprot:2076436-Amphidinium_carterae.1
MVPPSSPRSQQRLQPNRHCKQSSSVQFPPPKLGRMLLHPRRCACTVATETITIAIPKKKTVVGIK